VAKAVPADMVPVILLVLLLAEAVVELAYLVTVPIVAKLVMVAMACPFQ
jgi:hypothetical protein